MNRNTANRLLTGLVIITVGVIFLLRQLGYIDLSFGELFSTYWPVILLYFGVQQLLTAGAGGSGTGGLVLLAIGAIFLGNNLEVLSWSLGDIIPFLIPVVIIIVGLKMIWKPGGGRSNKPPADDEWKSYRPYGDDAPVPPAPPLHPDPTGLTEEPDNGPSSTAKKLDPSGMSGTYGTSGMSGTSGTSGATGSTYGYGYEAPKHGPDPDSSGHNKWKKWKHGGCNSDNEYVEWWNHGDSKAVNRSGFIGDIHMGQDYWELKPLNISHFIGDTVLDLTKAQIPFGETRITISSFIGDVKVYVPDDYELGVQVVSSAFIGDVKVLGQKDGGMFTSITLNSPRYGEADKKIKLVVSTFIGDTRVTKVG